MLSVAASLRPAPLSLQPTTHTHDTISPNTVCAGSATSKTSLLHSPTAEGCPPLKTDIQPLTTSRFSALSDSSHPESVGSEIEGLGEKAR